MKIIFMIVWFSIYRREFFDEKFDLKFKSVNTSRIEFYSGFIESKQYYENDLQRDRKNERKQRWSLKLKSKNWKFIQWILKILEFVCFVDKFSIQISDAFFHVSLVLSSPLHRYMIFWTFRSLYLWLASLSLFVFVLKSLQRCLECRSASFLLKVSHYFLSRLFLCLCWGWGTFKARNRFFNAS